MTVACAPTSAVSSGTMTKVSPDCSKTPAPSLATLSLCTLAWSDPYDAVAFALASEFDAESVNVEAVLLLLSGFEFAPTPTSTSRPLLPANRANFPAQVPTVIVASPNARGSATLVARIVKTPGVFPAMNMGRPLSKIRLPPVAVQVTEISLVPVTLALNACRPPAISTFTLPGLT